MISEKAHQAYQSGDLELSLQLCEEVLQQQPDHYIICQLLPMVLFKLGRIGDAISQMQSAVNRWHNIAEVHFSLSLMLLHQGDFARGWREYEWRLQVKGFVNPELNCRRWQGEMIDNQTIVVFCEQGFGDCIQFARYLPLVKQRCKKLIFGSFPALTPLFEHETCFDEITETVTQSDDYDCFTTLASLPRIFAANEANIPSAYPFLKLPQQMILSWQAKLPTNSYKRGTAWSGRQTHENNLHRSVSLDHFLPLSKLTGVTLISLQIHPQLEDIGPNQLIQTGAKIKSFADTASIIKNLDLVISVDTAIAHLALSLNVPTWVILPQIEEWRWVHYNGVCPWYPQVRFFQQKDRKHWKVVFDEIYRALQKDIDFVFISDG